MAVARNLGVQQRIDDLTVEVNGTELPRRIRLRLNRIESPLCQCGEVQSIYIAISAMVTSCALLLLCYY